jgi:hypothetical protein
MSDQADKAKLLRSLHIPGAPLVLPNAWDVGSARAVVDAGFPVVATASNAGALRQTRPRVAPNLGIQLDLRRAWHGPPLRTQDPE